MRQKVRNLFFIRKATKGHQKEGKKMCEWRRGLYWNQSSLLFMPVLLFGCLWGALYWSLVSDDVKYKLPLIQIHYLLEALVSPQLQIYVTKNPRSAGLWWSWRPVAPLALAVQEFPFYYLRFLTLHFFQTFGFWTGLFVLFFLTSSWTAAKSGFRFWIVLAMAVCPLWNVEYYSLWEYWKKCGGFVWLF